MANPLQDAMNDNLVKAAMPALQKFLNPVLEEARIAIRKLLLGDTPPKFRDHLAFRFGNPDLKQEDADLVWSAVGDTLQQGEPDAQPSPE